MNSCIEIHDTEVAEIRCFEAGVVVRFVNAYVHRSEGRPGVDAGTGWSQEAELFLAEATIIGKVPPLPCLLVVGTLVVGSHSHEDLIPLPLDSQEQSTITLCFGYLDFGIEVQGRSSRLQLVGEARYVDDFAPTGKSPEPE
jgi:hypothetical protein